ncbi:hypothetical protein SPOG_02223 [Schizosaccharomyces cryophilus OY26]|uniref:Uncharacterized protein n=1 Tax=Schizosaccharomyces cryophilus (strain OY26 / ATCC MYA-4695 / CBS 11777 / NBRC 106824 / NRRL Y48691) TaxID=653667 RepID=S9VXV2_SCHCR|nr:uncharacterized protein SPOG_02223 [Schizosaccharomyces cryophilus OY26]EPY51044.1 hypothetical protein SPOG_02223 [Schizosaccharomyces cryophilus OY26]
MKLLLFITIVACFLNRTISSTTNKADYPFYIQVFPYDSECSGNLSFIANAPVVDGKGAYSYLENVSSVLAVPAEDGSVTCLALNKTLPTCFSGSEPRCFQMSSDINRFTLSINDSSHPVKGTSNDYTTGFHYLLTPNTTFEYVHNTSESKKNNSSVLEETFLFECHRNKSCVFNLQLSNQTLSNCSDAKTCLQSGNGGAFGSVDVFLSTIFNQLGKTSRRTHDSFISPNLKTISSSNAVNVTKIDVSASPSPSSSSSSGSSSASSTSPTLAANKLLITVFIFLTFALFFAS